jgi:hypothetical protein
MESTTISCTASPLLHVKSQGFHVDQKQKHSIFSSMFPMRNTCTSYLQRHMRWSSQLGATQDEAILLRGRKNFHWPQRLYFLHLHHMSLMVRSRLVESSTPEQSQSSMCTFFIGKKGVKTDHEREPLTSPHGTGQRGQSPCRPCWIRNLMPVWVSNSNDRINVRKIVCKHGHGSPILNLEYFTTQPTLT